MNITVVSEANSVKIEGHEAALPIEDLLAALNQLEQADGYKQHVQIANPDVEAFLIRHKFAVRYPRVGCSKTKKTKKLFERLVVALKS